MKSLLAEVCKLDNELRKVFLGELVRAEEETAESIDRHALKRIDSGEPFKGVNVWERAIDRYKNTLGQVRKKIKKLNKELISGKVIKWEELIGFFGFLLGYHEYVVHPVRIGSLFKEGNSGYFFLSLSRRFSGIKKGRSSWLGSAAFNNFCVAYYVAKNSSPEVETHFASARDDEFDFSGDKSDIDKALESARNLKRILSENPVRSFIKNINKVYMNSKSLAERNPYGSPVMLTISEAKPDKRIKRFQCRVAQGPLTPPEPNVNLYEESETVRWHEGISEDIRRKFTPKKK